MASYLNFKDAGTTAIGWGMLAILFVFVIVGISNWMARKYIKKLQAKGEKPTQTQILDYGLYMINSGVEYLIAHGASRYVLAGMLVRMASVIREKAMQEGEKPPEDNDSNVIHLLGSQLWLDDDVVAQHHSDPEPPDDAA